MTTVRKQASLAEATVQQAETLAATHRSPRRATTRRSGGTRVATKGVHPQVWATALRLAGGDARRLKVEDPTTVLVVNHRQGRRQ